MKTKVLFMMVSGIAKVSSLLRRYESFIYRGQGELEGQGRIGEREGGIGIGEGSRGVEEQEQQQKQQ